jgi:RNA ligase
LFEIIYPENRIVVDYKGEEKLVVLAVIHTETGNEVPDSSLFFMEEDGWELVMTYKTWGEGYDLLKEEIQKDREGYVIRFKNGFRMKIKGEEYKRLHKLLTGISSRDIWNHVKDNIPLDDIIKDVPDEFYDWVKETALELKNKFEKIDFDYRLIFKNITENNNIIDKKTFAQYAISYKHSSILFSLYDKKPYNHIIWKLIYPEYTKPFKKDEN